MKIYFANQINKQVFTTIDHIGKNQVVQNTQQYAILCHELSHSQEKDCVC